MKNIILIGYKSVGKSAVGKELARTTGMRFIDLDEELEKIYKVKNNSDDNCRSIMRAIGQDAFRNLEHEVLKDTLDGNSNCILSLGGGTPLLEQNKELLGAHTVVQITAPKNVVFERIMINGKPAFFRDDEHPLISFNRTWEDRMPIYDSLADIKVENSGSLPETVKIIRDKIN